MNDVKLLAILIRGENLRKLYNIVENQKTVSTSRLENILDEIVKYQKSMVRAYQSYKKNK